MENEIKKCPICKASIEDKKWTLEDKRNVYSVNCENCGEFIIGAWLMCDLQNATFVYVDDEKINLSEIAIFLHKNKNLVPMKKFVIASNTNERINQDEEYITQKLIKQ